MNLATSAVLGLSAVVVRRSLARTALNVYLVFAVPHLGIRIRLAERAPLVVALSPVADRHGQHGVVEEHSVGEATALPEAGSARGAKSKACHDDPARACSPRSKAAWRRSSAEHAKSG